MSGSPSLLYDLCFMLVSAFEYNYLVMIPTREHFKDFIATIRKAQNMDNKAGK